MMVNDNYTRFVSTDPKLDFSFLYPASWHAQEFHEKEYGQVIIGGPRNSKNTYSTALYIVAVSAGATHLDQKVNDYLEKAAKSRDFKLISKAKGVLASAEAIELLVSYRISLPLNSVHPEDTTIMERRIIVERGTQFYELVYRTVEEEYYAYLSAFENAVRTFEFRAGEARRFRPLVIPVSVPAPEPVYTLAERREDYNAKG